MPGVVPTPPATNSPAPCADVSQDVINADEQNVKSSAASVFADDMPADGGATLATAESAYNALLKTLDQDLTTRSKWLSWATTQSHPLDTEDAATLQADQANAASNSQTLKDLESWNNPPRDSFIATGVTQGPGGAIPGTSYPGYSTPATQANNTAISPGYVQPPQLDLNDMDATVASMSPAQCSFLGWSLVQNFQHQQVTVPPGDARAWDTLATWMLHNNNRINVQSAPSAAFSDGAEANMGAVADAVGDYTNDTKGFLSFVGTFIAPMALGFVTDGLSDALLGADAIGGGVSATDDVANAVGVASYDDETLADVPATFAAANQDDGTAAQLAAEASVPVELTDGVEFGPTEASAAQSSLQGTSMSPGEVDVVTAPKGDTDFLTDGAQQPALPANSPDQYANFENEPVWGPQGPTPEDFQQGDLGDCWFSAVLRGIAARAPQYLQNLIKPGFMPGEYDVTLYLPDGTPQTVTVDASLPANSSGNLTLLGRNAQGIGGALIEKAAAKLLSYEPDATRASGYSQLVAGSPLKATDLLYPPAERQTTFLWWDGIKMRGALLDSSGQITTKYPSRTADSLWSSIDQRLTYDTTPDANGSYVSKSPATIVIGPNPTPGLGVVGNHAYTVMGYDSATQTVTLLNPNSASSANTINVTLPQLRGMYAGFAL